MVQLTVWQQTAFAESPADCFCACVHAVAEIDMPSLHLATARVDTVYSFTNIKVRVWQRQSGGYTQQVTVLLYVES